MQRVSPSPDLHVNSDLLNPGLHVSKIPRSFLCMSQFET